MSSGNAGDPPNCPTLCSPARVRRNRSAGRSNPIQTSTTAGGSVARATAINAAAFPVDSKIPTGVILSPAQDQTAGPAAQRSLPGGTKRYGDAELPGPGRSG